MAGFSNNIGEQGMLRTSFVDPLAFEVVSSEPISLFFRVEARVALGAAAVASSVRFLCERAL